MRSFDYVFDYQAYYFSFQSSDISHQLRSFYGRQLSYDKTLALARSLDRFGSSRPKAQPHSRPISVTLLSTHLGFVAPRSHTLARRLRGNYFDIPARFDDNNDVIIPTRVRHLTMNRITQFQRNTANAAPRASSYPVTKGNPFVLGPSQSQ